ncbi:metallophosphoesterase, partial [Thermodesulfobacteriota bacterium]
MKTYILGDVHGAHKRCLEILHGVNIVDKSGGWTRGLTDRLIQVGDLVDRGEMPYEAFMLFRELQEEARREGGEVVRLLGNHELS